MTIIFVLCAVLIAFLFFWLVLYKKESASSDVKKADVSYVCNECGEKHCNCYKSDE